MTKAEKLADRFTALSISEFREFQRILAARGFVIHMIVSAKDEPEIDFAALEKQIESAMWEIK